MVVRNDFILGDLTTAELAVLGAVVASGGDALDDLSLRSDDFNDVRHGNLFELMLQMREQGKHIDPVTLTSEQPDNTAFFWSLTDHAPFAHAVNAYAEIVAAHGMHRRMRSIAAGLLALSPEMSVDHMLERAQELVDSAAGEVKSKVRLVRDILPGVIERLQSNATFVPSPWESLNAFIGGFRPGGVYVIAARPGVGKTVIAAQIAAALAARGIVAFSSLEMSEDELVSRLMAERLSIAVGKLKDNNLSDYDWQIVAQKRDQLDELNIAIDDRSSVSGVEVRAHAKAVSRNGRLAGVVVDYMQLMSSKSKLERHLQVAEFSRQMKVMAKDFKVPVIALSQLNRQSESRVDRIPRLADLRESGAIEQDADVVILLRREENPGHTYMNPNESIFLDVAKNRHGETGEVELSWQGRYSRAVEYTS